MKEEGTTQPRWAIYERGHDLEALTDREARCRRVADQILGLTTPPVAVWTDIGTCREGQGQPCSKPRRNTDFDTLLTTSPDRISRDLAQYRDIAEYPRPNTGSEVIFADVISRGRRAARRHLPESEQQFSADREENRQGAENDSRPVRHQRR